MKTTTIHIRVDKTLKDDAAKVFKAIGIDFSGAIKLFLSNVVTEGSLGFTPMTKSGLKFKYFQEYKRKLSRSDRMWKEILPASSDDMVDD